MASKVLNTLELDLISFELTYIFIIYKPWNAVLSKNIQYDSFIVGIVTEDNFFGLSRSASFLKTLLDGQPDSEPNFSDVPIPGVGSESTERYFSVGYREILTGGENAGFFESAAVSTLEIQEINSKFVP